MKNKIQTKAKNIAKNPKVKEAVSQMKPNKTIWGFLGVVLFFIVPEIVGFIWGEEITHYANEALQQNNSSIEAYYKALVMLFEDGGSWINLLIGVVFLIWLFF